MLLGALTLHAAPTKGKGKKPAIEKTEVSKKFSDSSSSSAEGLRRYAVFTNQQAVGDTTVTESTNNIPWDGGNLLNSPQIVVGSNGNITIQKPGIYYVQYTVRVDQDLTPPGSLPLTSTATAQLMQTVNGSPMAIPQHAVIKNSSEVSTDFTEDATFETQITGWALIRVLSSSNNVISLAITLTGNSSIPQASGDDANAEIVFLQVN